MSAFSLIEISIVILIIGILIAGVTQSSRLLTQAKLSSAKTMTQSAPVASIKNLSLWIESTSDSSFQSADLDTGTTLTTWNDINPQAVTKASFATGSTVTLPSSATVALTAPIYRTNIINGLPAVDFSAGSTSMAANNFPAISTAATVFAVVKLPSTTLAAQAIFSKRPAGGGTHPNIEFSTTALTGWKYLDGANATGYTPVAAVVPTLASGTYVVSVVYSASSISGAGTSTATGYNFFQNGGNTGYSGAMYGATTSNNPNTSLGADDVLFLGRQGLTSSPTYFTGHIGEIIIYDRALKKEERQSIEAYLGKKWGITMTTASY